MEDDEEGNGEQEIHKRQLCVTIIGEFADVRAANICIYNLII